MLGRSWAKTIIPARYGGVYEGGRWLAFDCEYDEVPSWVYGDDIACASWFGDNTEPVGRGDTPAAALVDLETQLREAGETTAGMFPPRYR